MSEPVEGSHPDLVVVAEVHGRAALLPQLRAVLSELAAGTLDEEGCIEFHVLAAEEPGEFVLLESWKSEQALREHYGTPHYRYYREQVGPLLARPSDVVIHRIATTVRALDPNPPEPGKLG